MDFCTDRIQRGIFTHYKHTPVLLEEDGLVEC